MNEAHAGLQHSQGPQTDGRSGLRRLPGTAQDGTSTGGAGCIPPHAGWPAVCVSFKAILLMWWTGPAQRWAGRRQSRSTAWHGAARDPHRPHQLGRAPLRALPLDQLITYATHITATVHSDRTMLAARSTGLARPSQRVGRAAPCVRTSVRRLIAPRASGEAAGAPAVPDASRLAQTSRLRARLTTRAAAGVGGPLPARRAPDARRRSARAAGARWRDSAQRTARLPSWHEASSVPRAPPPQRRRRRRWRCRARRSR
jgi:hypothetical protein